MISRVAVAVASRSLSSNEALRSELVARWGDVRFNETGRTLEGDELMALLGGAPRVIVGLERIDDITLARLPELRLVSKFGVGLDTLDLAALARRGVRVGWTAGVNRRSVAELALTFALVLRRGLPCAHRLVSEGRWAQPVGRELSGATVGVVGCGNIGRELIGLLAPFRCRLLAHDRLAQPELQAAHGVTPVGLRELLSESDVVSLHLPLDASTRGLLDGTRLSWMKRGSILVNTARGGIVDETALCERLDDGSLAAVGLDVFSGEPPTNSRLVRHPACFGTPHIGGSTEEAILAMGRAAIENLERARPAGELLATASPVVTPGGR